MACYHPLEAHRPEGGGKLLFGNNPDCSLGKIQIPCGRCIGCRLDRTRQWMVRCVHESQMHVNNCFITLTYDDEHLPYGGDLHYPHFQLFMKALRNRVGNVRFYMCGEYGEQFKRPHFHACLFGYMPPDLIPFSSTRAGMIWTSKEVDSSWTRGFASVANFSADTAAYVAGYVMKKVTGDLAESHYAKLVPETGELIVRKPEFNRMSLRPGIGRAFFDKWGVDVFPHDFCIVDGHQVKVPRYYDKLEAARIGIGFDAITHKRAIAALDNSSEGAHDRLRVREIVTRARLSRMTRTLE